MLLEHGIHEVSIAEAAELMFILTEAGHTVMLWGAPGLGKSDSVHQMGAKTKRKVIEFHAALRDTVDLRGIPVSDLITGKTRWLIPDELPNAERDGEFGYLFCDEINQASPQMQGVLGGLVLSGAVGDYRLPPGWRVVCAGNRVSDRAAAQRMPTHMRNKMAHLYVKSDVGAWVKWANTNAISPELVAFVRLRGDDVLHVMPKGDENAFPTPRSLTKCSPFVGADKKHRLRLFAAHVGEAVAAELDGFIELYQSLGDMNKIVADPDNAPVPTEPSCKFAVATCLARMADRKNFANIIRYAERMDDEREVLLVTDATNRDPSLKNLACYGKWAVKNQHLTLQ